MIGSGEAMRDAPIDLSIIIPTRNSASDLERCLDSFVSEASPLTIEVIVVDQESTDSTRTLAGRAGATVMTTSPSATYTPPTRSRNLGASRARGEFLAHLDADMTVSTHALRDCIAFARTQGYVAMVLEEVDVHEGFWAACKALERRAYRGTGLEAARLVRADVFHAAGGYDESLGSGEDWDVHTRYAEQGRIGRQAAAIHHHLGRISLTAQLRKKFGYGRSAAAFMGKHDARSFSGVAIRAYARSWPVFARDPLHTLGFLALRVAEAVALVLGAVAEAARRRRFP